MALKKITGNGVAKSDMDIKKALSLSHKKGDGFRYIAELEAENAKLKAKVERLEKERTKWIMRYETALEGGKQDGV